MRMNPHGKPDPNIHDRQYLRTKENDHRTLMNDLEGKVALVTGGARGLGAETCRSLADVGVTVVAGDVRTDGVEQLAGDLSANGCAAHAVDLDVTDRYAAESVVDDVVETFGTIDILINNAGIDVTKSIEELEFEELDRVLSVNLRGPFVMSKLVFPQMRKQGGGHIVNVASTAARRAWANASPYHASKWGLLGLSHALHVEGREHNVKVTALIAGGMQTPFLLDRFPDIDKTTLQDPGNVARAIRYVLSQPDGTVIPEMMVLPTEETSWP